MWISAAELIEYLRRNQIAPRQVRVYLASLPGLRQPQPTSTTRYHLPPDEYEGEDEEPDEED